MHRIVTEPIDVSSIEASARSPSYGGVVTFLGVVRDRADDGAAVVGLEYEAHEAMALAEFSAIEGEAHARFGDVRVAVAHRIGALKVGDVAVAVCVAAAHRAAAFDACEYVIDELKRRAPIWKKELYAAGAAQWKANVGDE